MAHDSLHCRVNQLGMDGSREAEPLESSRSMCEVYCMIGEVISSSVPPEDLVLVTVS
jgi:hypothetical protein